MSELNELDRLHKITHLLLRDTSRAKLVEVVGAAEGVASRMVRLSKLMSNNGDSRYHDKYDLAFILAMLEKALEVRGHEDRTYDPADHCKTVMHYARTLASDINAVNSIISKKNPHSQMLVAIKSGCWDCPSGMIPVVIQTAKTIRDRQLNKNPPPPLPQIDGFLPSGSTFEHNAPSTVLPDSQPDSQSDPQPDPQPDQQPKEMTMTHPAIVTRTFIFGVESSSVGDDEIFDKIAELETQAEALNKTKNKPKKLQAKIDSIMEDIKKLVEFVDDREQ